MNLMIGSGRLPPPPPPQPTRAVHTTAVSANKRANPILILNPVGPKLSPRPIPFFQFQTWTTRLSRMPRSRVDIQASQFQSAGLPASHNSDKFSFLFVPGSSNPSVFLAEAPDIVYLRTRDRKSTRLNSSHTDISR